MATKTITNDERIQETVTFSYGRTTSGDSFLVRLYKQSTKIAALPIECYYTDSLGVVHQGQLFSVDNYWELPYVAAWATVTVTVKFAVVKASRTAVFTEQSVNVDTVGYSSGSWATKWTGTYDGVYNASLDPINGVMSSVSFTQTLAHEINLSWTSTSTNAQLFRVIPVVNGVDTSVEIEVGGGTTRSRKITTTDWAWPIPSVESPVLLSFRVRGENPSSTPPSYHAYVTSSAASPVIPEYAWTPPPVTELTATVVSSAKVKLDWTNPAYDNRGEWTMHVLLGTSDSADFASVIDLDGTSKETYEVSGLSAGTSYYFWVQTKRNGVVSNTGTTATTPSAPEGTTLEPKMTLTPGANVSCVNVAGNLYVFSDLDRAKVFSGGVWYQAGLKPFVSAPTIAVSTGGGLNGRFTAYVRYYRSTSPPVRSVPSPASASTGLVTNASLSIQVPLSGGAVPMRDYGYDSDGNQVNGADFYELYLKDEDAGDAFLVARRPITTTSAYTIPATVTKETLAAGYYRPMEQLGENTIPPVCGSVVYWNNRIWAFGERTIKPGGILTVTGGSNTITIADAEFTDAIFNKELYVNRKPTGWYVTDVVSATTATISHTDPTINESGYNGLDTGEQREFAFAGRPSRVYTSAYYTGEAGGGSTWCPEGFPPLAMFEQEFDPDDGESVLAASVSRDALYMFKQSKIFVVRGGTELDTPLISVSTIARGSGLLGPKTVCRDRYDTPYYLSDQGLHRVRESGVELVNVASGGAWQFQRYYDVTSISGAVAEWFGREDYFVVAGLRKIGETDYNAGFIYDSRNNAILPFTTPMEITSLRTLRDSRGESILMYGDDTGKVGLLLASGIYADTVPLIANSADETTVKCSVTSGAKPAYGSKSSTVFYPRIYMDPKDTTTTFTLRCLAADRISDPTDFDVDAATSATFTSVGTFPRHRIAPTRGASHIYRLEFEPPRGERVTFRGIETEDDNCGQ